MERKIYGLGWKFFNYIKYRRRLRRRTRLGARSGQSGTEGTVISAEEIVFKWYGSKGRETLRKLPKSPPFSITSCSSNYTNHGHPSILQRMCNTATEKELLLLVLLLLVLASVCFDSPLHLLFSGFTSAVSLSVSLSVGWPDNIHHWGLDRYLSIYLLLCIRILIRGH